LCINTLPLTEETRSTKEKVEIPTPIKTKQAWMAYTLPLLLLLMMMMIIIIMIMTTMTMMTTMMTFVLLEILICCNSVCEFRL